MLLFGTVLGLGNLLFYLGFRFLCLLELLMSLDPVGLLLSQALSHHFLSLFFHFFDFFLELHGLFVDFLRLLFKVDGLGPL